ncbi:peptidylprolyl isomerase [Thermodesulfobacteriota bacterium]
MKKSITGIFAISLFLMCLSVPPLCAQQPPAAENPQVILETTLGSITIELNRKQAPLSVANFLEYVDAGFFNATIFHRVIPGFMVQCGGFDKAMQKKKTRAAIKNEADNGLSNKRGSLAMARTQIKDSATSQFFINLKDNTFLDHGVKDYGYAVFGHVVKGMDVVDKIAAVKTGNRSGRQNVPLEPVVITAARRQQAAAPAKK